MKIGNTEVKNILNSGLTCYKCSKTKCSILSILRILLLCSILLGFIGYGMHIYIYINQKISNSSGNFLNKTDNALNECRLIFSIFNLVIYVILNIITWVPMHISIYNEPPIFDKAEMLKSFLLLMSSISIILMHLIIFFGCFNVSYNLQTILTSAISFYMSSAAIFFNIAFFNFASKLLKMFIRPESRFDTKRHIEKTDSYFLEVNNFDLSHSSCESESSDLIISEIQQFKETTTDKNNSYQLTKSKANILCVQAQVHSAENKSDFMLV